MKSISHREAYTRLLSDHCADTLIQSMKQEDVVAGLGALAIERRFDLEGLPFLHIRVDTEDIFGARLTGLFLTQHMVRPLVPAYRHDFFYLPTICYCDTYPPSVAELIDPEASLTHELIHLRDMLGIIEKDATFVTRLRAYGLGGLESPKQLAKSVDLEVYKIFTLEPPAFKSDFQHGDRVFRMQFLGQILTHQCTTEEEYIRCQLADYIATLEASYQEKFPDQREAIRRHIRHAVNRHGRAIFGANAHDACREEHESMMRKLIDGMLR